MYSYSWLLLAQHSVEVREQPEPEVHIGLFTVILARYGKVAFLERANALIASFESGS